MLFWCIQVAREAAKRVLGLRPFDVQLMGGMILNEGQIAEMRTGEGKTLVAVLPAYLNALSGKGVHVVTVRIYSLLYCSHILWYPVHKAQGASLYLPTFLFRSRQQISDARNRPTSHEVFSTRVKNMEYLCGRVSSWRGAQFLRVSHRSS